MGDLNVELARQTATIYGTDSSGNLTNPVGADANLNLKVIDYATGSTGSAIPADASNIGAKNPSGNLVNLLTDASANLLVNVQASALPTGASTAANQATEITSLQLLDNPVGGGTGGAPGTAGTNSFLIGGVYNTTLPVATNGQQTGIQTDANGRLLVSSSPLPTTASKFSFGGVTTAASAVVPVESTTYTEVTTNAAMTLVSSSANDASAGTGARTVSVTYYDQNMTGPQVVTITMNGTTAVTSPNNNMAYIEKMVIATVGSGGSNAGAITLKSGATTVGSIPAGQNETGWAHHYVPQGKTSYISGFSVSTKGTAANQGGLFILRASTPTIANTPEIQISDFLNAAGITSGIVRVYNSPIQVVGPARVRAYVLPGATSSYTSYAAFDYIDN